MKKLFVIAVAALALAACATVGQPVQLTSKTPAQIASDVCPPLQAALEVLTVPGAIDPGSQADLVATSQAVGVVCSLGDAAQVSDLRAISEQVIPFVVRNVVLMGIPDPQKQEIVLALAVAKAALGAVVK